MVEGEGFEPSKAEPTDLQSVPVDRLGIPPTRNRLFLYKKQNLSITYPNKNLIAAQFRIKIFGTNVSAPAGHPSLRRAESAGYLYRKEYHWPHQITKNRQSQPTPPQAFIRHTVNWRYRARPSLLYCRLPGLISDCATNPCLGQKPLTPLALLHSFLPAWADNPSSGNLFMPELLR